MTDTHMYDGKIKNILPTINLSNEEKKEKCSLLLQKELSEEAKHFLKCLINDIGKESNFDNTNKLNADDLLCLCADKNDNVDFIKELEIQLCDMKTGFCPQGRTHRLYQILVSFDN